jgi:hypothetical protein
MKPSSDIALLTTTLPFPVSLTVTSESAVGGREGLEPHNLRIKVRSFAAALGTFPHNSLKPRDRQ